MFKVRVIRKGPNEFELQSENEGRGKIYAHIKTGGHDKLFNVQVLVLLFGDIIWWLTVDSLSVLSFF